MHRFRYPDPLIPGQAVILSADESHHLVHVLRLRESDLVCLVDGAGKVAMGKITLVSARGAGVQVETVETLPTHSRVLLGIGICKPVALEFILRRATEIGVAGFQPLATQHSGPLSHWNERRWQKIIHEVGKQCEEAHFPVLHPPMPLTKWMAEREPSRLLILCDESARDATLQLSQAPGIDLLVGAEGGWSREETETLRSAGALSFGLGKNRLRAETAALVSVVLLKQRLGEI